MELQDSTVLIAVGTLGFIALIKPFFRFFKWVWVMFLRKPKNLRECYGQWAVVTGSTDGIGKAIAFELASKGLNLVLVGRNPSKLKSTINQIREKFNNNQTIRSSEPITPCNKQPAINVKDIVIDFEKWSEEEIAREIEEGIKGLDIGVLVNNAGLAYPYARFFHEVGLELMESVMRVNLNGSNWVTKPVIDAMLKKGKGAVVNIGSGSCVVLPSYPLYAVYAATKAYVAMFSRSIHSEYKNRGIDIQCQVPLFVATKMTRIRRGGGFVVATPEAYAKASVKWIGYDEGICTPMWTHSIQGFLLQVMPNALIERCVLQYFLGMRTRGRVKEGFLS